MCGIAGYVDFSYGAPLPHVLAAMSHALKRRGPDGQGTLMEGACGLAHARLSIIDIEGSPQPMRVPGSDLSLVYNGELYNYVELRSDLQHRGETFTTAGDTEVVLRSISRDWDRSLAAFDGMFGLAAWDRRAERLLLARDPFGEKPLFYATPSPGVLVFGSEIKALLEHPAIHHELDEGALRQVLRFRAVYGTRSLYEGISQLEPGSYLEFSRYGIKVSRYFDVVAESDRSRASMAGLTDRQLIDQGQGLLAESVQRRMIADVPVGAFLSGGLDSSLIVALMRQARGEDAPLHSFSVGFSGDECTELPHARRVAKTFATTHNEVGVSESDYIQRLAELTACRDAPISEPSDVAIAQMSRIARQSVKVVLSGEGADEVFGGYPKYAFADAWRALRWSVRTVGAARTARVAGMCGLDRRRALVAARALAMPSELDRVVQWFSYLDRPDLSSLLPGLNWDDVVWASCVEPQQEALERSNGWSALGRMQIVDCLSWLPCNLLERGDRMTMAEGLESRPPFLSKKLAAFGLALPDRLKVRGRTGKWIVRQWAQNHLPPEIISRKKWGFRVPLAQWFRGGMRDMLFGYLQSPSGLCGRYGAQLQVQALLDQHDSGRIDANLTLWTLLVAEVWYQDVFQRRHRHLRQPAPLVGSARVTAEVA